MLLGNYNVFNKILGRAYSGTVLYDSRSNFSKTESNLNRYLAFTSSGSSVPYNYLPPYCWIMSFKTNLLTSGNTTLLGTGTTTAGITGNFYLESSLTGNTTISASGQTIASGTSTTVQISATITTYTETSPENMTKYVWNAASSLYLSGGTMGYLMSETNRNGKITMGLSI